MGTYGIVHAIGSITGILGLLVSDETETTGLARLTIGHDAG